MTNKFSNSISFHAFARSPSMPPMSPMLPAFAVCYATIIPTKFTIFASLIASLLHCCLAILLLAIWRTSVAIFSCSDYIEIFPFLREPVIENSTNPDYVICNHTTSTVTSASVSALASKSAVTPLAANRTVARKAMQTTQATQTTHATQETPPTTVAAKQKMMSVNANAASMATSATKKATPTMNAIANYAHSTVIAANNSVAGTVADLRSNEFIYSAGKFFGIRVRFKEQQQDKSLRTDGDDAFALKNWLLNITGEYRFLKKEYFQNDGRLIPGSYCDYYFFADANAKPESLEIWQYFHSPRFPAKYPAHIKCAYKFIGRPESRVEIVFEELQLPKKDKSCSIDKLTVFDSESANMNAVIDVICDALPTRRIISSGPDLLIEFNASSNVTAKGFRGKFKFIHNEIEDPIAPAILKEHTTEKFIALERIGLRKETQHPVLSVDEWTKFFKNNGLLYVVLFTFIFSQDLGPPIVDLPTYCADWNDLRSVPLQATSSSISVSTDSDKVRHTPLSQLT